MLLTYYFGFLRFSPLEEVCVWFCLGTQYLLQCL